MAQLREGGCQCGFVRYQLEGEPLGIAVCHCTECQRQSGSAFGMSIVIRREALRLIRGALKTFTRTADSGHAVVCAFCPDCGVRIYHEPRWLDGILTVKPGTLDDTSFLRPTMEVWTKRKHGWLELHGDVQSFESNPPLPPVGTRAKDAGTTS
jgi:hypothetical protein